MDDPHEQKPCNPNILFKWSWISTLHEIIVIFLFPSFLFLIISKQWCLNKYNKISFPHRSQNNLESTGIAWLYNSQRISHWVKYYKRSFTSPVSSPLQNVTPVLTGEVSSSADCPRLGLFPGFSISPTYLEQSVDPSHKQNRPTTFSLRPYYISNKFRLRTYYIKKKVLIQVKFTRPC